MFSGRYSQFPLSNPMSNSQQPNKLTLYSTHTELTLSLSSDNINTNQFLQNEIEKLPPYGRLFSSSCGELHPSAAYSGALRAHFIEMFLIFFGKFFSEHFFQNFFLKQIFRGNFVMNFFLGKILLGNFFKHTYIHT